MAGASLARDSGATADAPLKERLASAFHSHLLGLTPQDLADADLQIDFESLYVNAESGKVLRTRSRTRAGAGPWNAAWALMASASMTSGLGRDPVVNAQEEEGRPQPAVVQAEQDGETPFTVE